MRTSVDTHGWADLGALVSRLRGGGCGTAAIAFTSPAWSSLITRAAPDRTPGHAGTLAALRRLRNWSHQCQDFCDLDIPRHRARRRASPPCRSRSPDTTSQRPRPGSTRRGGGALGTPRSTIRAAASGSPARRSRRGCPLSVQAAVSGVHPVRGHLAVPGVAAGLGLGVHHLLGEPADHLPQQVGARRGQGLLELRARTGTMSPKATSLSLVALTPLSKDHEVAASHHSEMSRQGTTVTSVSRAPYITFVDANRFSSSLGLYSFLPCQVCLVP
jgi:hypothetical protein